MKWLQQLWPLDWFCVLTMAKDFTTHPVLGSPKLNARGPHVWRKLTAQRSCDDRRRRMKAALPAEREFFAQWDAEGIMLQTEFLGAEHLAAVRAELYHGDFQMIEMLQPPTLTRRVNLDTETCRDHYPALHRLITDPRLLARIRYAAGYGGQPIIAIQCIHGDSDGEADPSRHDPQTDWHVDTFHSTAKAWLFLHDVALDEGPLAYVRGTHICTTKRLDWERRQSIEAPGHANPLHAKGSFRISDAELVAMGCRPGESLAVNGNTLVVADTSGFHRRTPSQQPTVRIELYMSLRRNPFFAGLYPSALGLPWIRGHWAQTAFRIFLWLWQRGTPSWIPSQVAELNDAEKAALMRGQPPA